MDPYETEAFFKLSEAQRSQLLYVRLKHLEHELSDLRMKVNMEGGRGVEPYNGPVYGGGPVFTVDHEAACQQSSRVRSTGKNAARRAAVRFSLASNSLEHDLQHQPMSTNRPAANDRPLYLQKLIKVDSLCKEEMARMAAARQNLEPLNQMACDWKLEEIEEEGKHGDYEGLTDRRMTRERERSYEDEYLSALASTSKGMSTLELTKMSRHAHHM